MKVLYLSTGVFDKGGISRYSRYQIEAMRSSGIVKKLYAMSLWPRKGDIFEDDFHVDRAYSGIPVTSKAHFTSDALGIAAAMHPDVVWANHLCLGFLALSAAKLVKGVAVTNIYGREVWSDPGRLSLWSLRHCWRVVSDCHFTADWVAHNIHVDKRSVRVIWDCVDTKRFVPGEPDLLLAAKYGVPLMEGRIRLMTLGRLESKEMHKGYHRIIKMLAEVKESLPLDYIIAGTGPALPDLKELAEGLGVQDIVHFTGSVAEADLVGIYRLADVFVLISDRAHGRGEGIPLSPLEAAACGKPILVGNEDGSCEAVEDGINGFILSPHDNDRLIERLRFLVENAAARKIMGSAARQRIESLHSFEGFQQEMKKLLLERKIAYTPMKQNG